MLTHCSNHIAGSVATVASRVGGRLAMGSDHLPLAAFALRRFFPGSASLFLGQ